MCWFGLGDFTSILKDTLHKTFMGVVLNLIVTKQLNSISNGKVMTVQSMTAISILKYFLGNNTEKHSNKNKK